MTPTIKTTKSEEMFSRLVLNAIEFFKRSVAELQDNPKYSVINFHASVELFFKARLMQEHWSLILTKPDQADYSKFIKGDFHSVSLDEAIKRLKNIAGESLSEEERKSFDRIREHRNQLVHLFHPNYDKKPDMIMLSSIVAEQCRAWFYLYKLLTERWRDRFQVHLSDIEKLNFSMHRHKDFLKVKFESLWPEIEQEIAEGAKFISALLVI